MFSYEFVRLAVKFLPIVVTPGPCLLYFVNQKPIPLGDFSLKHSIIKTQNSSTWYKAQQGFPWEGDILLLKEFLFQTPTLGSENSAANQGPANLPKVEEPQQKNTAPSDSPSRAAPKGSVQLLPDLDDAKPEGSQENGPVEAFPVQLDLTTNPQGEALDVPFLFLGPMKEKLVVLPFPKEEHRSAECPGPAQEANPLILPP